MHTPATDPEMMAIRESLDGPSNIAVIGAPDYAAPPLPRGFRFEASLRQALASAKAVSAKAAPLKFVEWRIIGTRPVLQALFGDKLVRVDLTIGIAAALPAAAEGPRSTSLRGGIKRWHRLRVLGDNMLWINALVGIGLLVMIVTGLRLYFQLLMARRRLGRSALFWSAGGWWRSLHRGTSTVAAAFLLVVGFTGTLLSIDSLALGLYRTFLPLYRTFVSCRFSWKLLPSTCLCRSCAE